MDNLTKKTTLKKLFSTLGFALITLFIVPYIVVLLPSVLFSQLLPSGFLPWLENILPIYAFGIPLTILIMSKFPASKPQPQKLYIKQLLSLLALCLLLMCVGGLLGNLPSWILSGGKTIEAMDAVEIHPSSIVATALLAPLMEELLFRKVLIDRIRIYGEKFTVLMSGLLFGVMHQNLNQFFGAFAIGCVFAYIYLRTGKLRYTVFLHTFINSLTAIPSIACILMGPDAKATAVIDVIISVVCYGLAALGLILLICKRYKPQWFPAEQQTPKKEALKAAFLNVGMILYLLMSLLVMIGTLMFTSGIITI